VNDTGDTIDGALTVNGVVRITANGDPDFIVEGAAGGDLLYVTQTYNEVIVANGGDFAVITGAPGAGGEVLRIAGETGNIHTVGAIEVDGALNHDGSTVGFYGAAPVSQGPNLTDRSTASISTTSWGAGEAAILGSLRTAFNELAAYLASRGDIADD
jgi:hypothetical protein